MRVLGVDPGTRFVGFGLVEKQGGNWHAVESGVINIPKLNFSEKLLFIYDQLLKIITAVLPDAMALEEVYVTQNAKTTLKLGHARGVIMLAAAQKNVPVYEYAPRSIKQAVCGQGGATKTQVQGMISQILKIPVNELKEDEADGLAAALCHAYRLNTSRFY